ncbi:UNVERIFIED_CONTAM: putative mitochondrial protein [Sesamum radiatum]|uniref:Mitochondrial protein n=1 Tax=Sesamum radiatum TaxID=300843 RepID=A0AAW2QGF4_SESRA
MNKEILALETNNTWEVTMLPPGKRAIGCKWVYKLKLKDDGIIDRYRARLVAKGYHQIEGVDYVNSFSSWRRPLQSGSFLPLITKVKQHLESLFTIKDFSLAKYFLGLEISRSPKGFFS